MSSRKKRLTTRILDPAKSRFTNETFALKEEAVCLYLSKANKIRGWYRVSTGGISGTVVDIRIVLYIALKGAACSIILAHNHPSGNLKPSEQDKELTRKLKESAKIMDIVLYDHLILSSQGYLSFADEGFLETHHMDPWLFPF